MLKQMQERRGSDEGFTLIELLIAIVVVGVLSAVVIVGIGGLNDSGKTGACKASKDAAKAAVAVHYANHAGVYPADLAAMVGLGELELNGATVTASTINGSGWTVIYTLPAAGPPTYASAPAALNCGT